MCGKLINRWLLGICFWGGEFAGVVEGIGEGRYEPLAAARNLLLR
jgi:hypothetical protein